MQFDPPQKGWVENWGLDEFALTSWMSDYEERQEAFHATNEKAELIMSGYRAKTEGVVGRLPQFQPEEKPPEERQLPPQSSQPPASSYMANTTMSTPSTPASTSSAWASPSGSGSLPSTATPGGGGIGDTPASTGSSWAGGSTLPQTAQMSYAS